MKTLILDESKWICGDPEGNTNEYKCSGTGITELLNEEGYMCCLGQFSLQLDKSLKKKDILCQTEPSDLGKIIPGLTKKFESEVRNTSLSRQAISINDDPCTTVEKKIILLKSLFSKFKYKIIVKDGTKRKKKTNKSK